MPHNLIQGKNEKPAAFLDRDGVINVDYGHVGKKNDIKYVKDSLQAIRYLKKLGFRVFVVTNQAGIAKGLYSKSDYIECMDKIAEDLKKYNVKIDDIRYCPFHKDAVIEAYYHEDHPWRKPNPGMILDILDHWPTCLKSSFLVGDNKSDVVAAENSNIKGYIFKQNQSLLNFIKTIPEVIKITHNKLEKDSND